MIRNRTDPLPLVYPALPQFPSFSRFFSVLMAHGRCSPRANLFNYPYPCFCYLKLLKYTEERCTQVQLGAPRGQLCSCAVCNRTGDKPRSCDQVAQGNCTVPLPLPLHPAPSRTCTCTPLPPVPSTTARATLLLHSIDEGIIHQTGYWPNIWPTLYREQNFSHFKCKSPSKFTVPNPHHTAGVARAHEPRLRIDFRSNLKTQIQIRAQT